MNPASTLRNSAVLLGLMGAILMVCTEVLRYSPPRPPSAIPEMYLVPLYRLMQFGPMIFLLAWLLGAFSYWDPAKVDPHRWMMRVGGCATLCAVVWDLYQSVAHRSPAFGPVWMPQRAFPKEMQWAAYALVALIGMFLLAMSHLESPASTERVLPSAGASEA